MQQTEWPTWVTCTRPQTEVINTKQVGWKKTEYALRLNLKTILCIAIPLWLIMQRQLIQPGSIGGKATVRKRELHMLITQQ